MLKNYLLTAVRSIRKNALTSLITIAGFSVGIACSLFIFLYVQNELSFDRFLDGHERIHRILVRAVAWQGGEFLTPNSSMEIKNILQSAEVESITQVLPTDAILGYGNTHCFEENKVLLTDPSFLKVFRYPLASGDGATALERPLTMILTPDMARKYFGAENPIGKTMSFGHAQLGGTAFTFTVTGILQPLPANSSFRFEFVLSVPFEQLMSDALGYYNQAYQAGARRDAVTLAVENFVRLKPGSALSSFERDLGAATDRLPQTDAKQLFKSYRLIQEPLDRMYLFSKVSVPGETRGSFLLIILLGGLGIIVIVIACMNVVNLTTARSMTRVKEIGIRKALGATRRELIVQYLVESVLLSFFSLFIAMIIVELFLPLFSGIVKRSLSIHYLSNPAYICGMIASAFFIGILAGFYPAFYLSSFGVVKVLRGQREPSSRRFREAMVIVQFVFSIGLFISSSVILREFQSVQGENLGFDPSNVLMARIDIPEVEKRFPDIKSVVSAVPGVTGVAAASFAGWEYGQLARDFPLMINARQQYCNVMVVDPEYLKVMGIRLSQGKDFDPNVNVNQLIVNEAAQSQLGYGLDTFAFDGPLVGRVIGTVKDFYYMYPSRRVKPLILTVRSPFLVNTSYTPSPIHLNYMLVRMQGGAGRQETIKKIEEAWKTLNPGYSLEYRLMDSEIRGQMDRVNWSSEAILSVSTVLAFLLSGLGLFGLGSFEMERRTKEVGIRKTLGATSLQIVTHFLLGFLKLIALANVIAWPLTFALTRVVFAALQYPRPLQIGPLVFLEAGALSVLVTVVTVGSQTLRAASANPVNTLRYE